MSAGASPIGILAVDDQRLVRQGICDLVGVQSDMLLMGEASNGREAIQQSRTQHPDVTLMGLQMPDDESPRRRRCPAAKVEIGFSPTASASL